MPLCLTDAAFTDAVKVEIVGVLELSSLCTGPYCVVSS